VRVSATSNMESRYVYGIAPTMAPFIEYFAFARNRTPIWLNHFCEKEIFGGMLGCLFGPFQPCSANSIATHRNWRISFLNFAGQTIWRRFCANASANCHVSHLITRSWKKRTAFWWWKQVSIGMTSAAGEQ